MPNEWLQSKWGFEPLSQGRPIPSPWELLLDHPDYIQPKQFTPSHTFPDFTLASKIMPFWQGITPTTGPADIYTLPKAFAYGLTDERNGIKRIGLHPQALVEALNALQPGRHALFHELAHYFQPNVVSQSNELSQTYKALANNSFSPFDANKVIDVAPEEQDAEVKANWIQQLLQAKRQNDYETSIGVRPH